jgi:phage tail-like protein
MDVNGTRFHLLQGKADWRRCRLAGQPQTVDDWYLSLTEGQAADWLRVGWDEKTRALTLRPLLLLFPRGQRVMPLQPSARRGAAVDRYGNWYWISNDQQRIFWRPSGSNRSQVYWTQTPTPRSVPAGVFHPQREEHPVIAELAGMAVTTSHYLIVGNVTQGGLFIFDLHAGGEPLLLLFPESPSSPPSRFAPFDMAPAPNSGVWVLDRTHRVYWGLDRHFRVITGQEPLHDMEPGEAFAFYPVDGSRAIRPSQQFPAGFPLEAQNPISIEALPDGSVLILDSPVLPASPGSSSAASILYHYRLGECLHTIPLEDDVDVVMEGEGIVRQHLSVIGHDLAYIESPDEKTLYVVERDGNQAIAFALNFAEAKPLTVQRAYLPLHSFGGRALLAKENAVFYDVVGSDPMKDTAVRWVQLQVIDQPRYQRTATLFALFDGKERDCVWHRLFVDACIPSETGVEVWTRTANDRQSLETATFVLEPPLYLRGNGGELPYYQPFPTLAQRSETTGTWELLFQQVRGRYLQLKLVLTGNGRTTPQVRALRAYYPRFSYSKQYLPAVYQEDAESAALLERLLANPEGFYTEIEGKIAEVSTIFDPRTAPAEALNWLAGWIGLILDPLWARIQERRQSPEAQSTTPAPDRRRLFIRYALTLYNQRGTLDGMRLALQLLLHPCLEATLQRFKTAAVQPDPALRRALEGLGLPYPTPVMKEEELERVLLDYVLTAKRPTKVRIVERFLTRGGWAMVMGDPTQAPVTPSTGDPIQASAHRFSVLIPEGLLPEEAAMVERIVSLEKPAHTLFEVRRYWDYFRVGEARLGIDTMLGADSRFVPMVLGRDHLATGYISPTYPLDVPERFVSDRDRVGERPL